MLVRTLAAAREMLGAEVDEVAWTMGSLHDLRRTCGTQMARAAPLHVLKEYMGHADIKTTRAFCLAAEGEDATRARRALDGFLGDKADAPGGRNGGLSGVCAGGRKRQTPAGAGAKEARRTGLEPATTGSTVERIPNKTGPQTPRNRLPRVGKAGRRGEWGTSPLRLGPSSGRNGGRNGEHRTLAQGIRW